MLQRALSGAAVASIREHEERFVGLTPAKADAYFDAQQGELELLTMFELLATAEAFLIMEFESRTAAKRKTRFRGDSAAFECVPISGPALMKISSKL
ncbi:hypothetical protein SBA4_2540004 [Candidatus Sulfopaludibacter sp. SbA4]|nr:hypothetical protein SBA4_2540004 [Candidatus Sulfopaludibacter sp. SbA4]